MNKTILPVAIIIGLIVLFYIVDRKEFRRHDDVRTVQTESLVENKTPSQVSTTEKHVSSFFEEKASQLKYDAPAIPRLGIPAYNWWNEVLHGVARAGTATVFPQAIGLAAMFDEDMQEEIAAAASQVDEETKAAIRVAREHVAAFSSRCIPKAWSFSPRPGICIPKNSLLP